MKFSGDVGVGVGVGCDEATMAQGTIDSIFKKDSLFAIAISIDSQE